MWPLVILIPYLVCAVVSEQLSFTICVRFKMKSYPIVPFSFENMDNDVDFEDFIIFSLESRELVDAILKLLFPSLNLSAMIDVISLNIHKE